MNKRGILSRPEEVWTHLKPQTDSFACHNWERPNAATNENEDKGIASSEFWSDHENWHYACDCDRYCIGEEP